MEEELPSLPQRRSQKPEAIPLPKPPSLQQQTSGTNIYSQFLLFVPQVLCGGPSGVTCAVMTMFCMGGVLPNLFHPAGGLGSMHVTPSWVRSAVFFFFPLCFLPRNHKGLPHIYLQLHSSMKHLKLNQTQPSLAGLSSKSNFPWAPCPHF